MAGSTEIDLDLLRYTVCTVVDRELLIAPEQVMVSISEHMMFELNQSFVKLELTLLGHRDLVEPLTVRYPDGWWQAFRARWFPRRWLRRHPVRQVEERINVDVVYSKVALPGRGPLLHAERFRAIQQELEGES